MVEFIESIGTFGIIMIIVMIVMSIYFGLLVYRLGKIADLLKEKPEFKTNKRKNVTSDDSNINLSKLIADLYLRIGNIERILSEVDDTPYIIEEEDE